MTTRTMLTLGGIAALLLPLTACGGDDTDTAQPEASPPAVTTEEGAAEEVTLRGDFAPVPDAPEGAADIGGTAEQVRTPDGASVTVALFGLAERSDYIAHLHVEPCSAADPGGPHFRFDADGEAAPPNEVHLLFSSDGVGSAANTVEVDQPLPDGEALTVVVHDAGADGQGFDEQGNETPKLACAEVS